jgi:hypothetical protein
MSRCLSDSGDGRLAHCDALQNVLETSKVECLSRGCLIDFQATAIYKLFTGCMSRSLATSTIYSG